MMISYKWLSDYLPVIVEPERLGKILTSIGLEVESMELYEEVKGGLRGLVIGEVLSVAKHPNADKLTITQVDTGQAEVLRIVCGAPNVAAGQKVLVAPVGATIYPVNGEPMTMKAARIRSEESQGMICAEDEVGLGSSHAGIMVLPSGLKTGSAAAEYFQPYSDFVFHIGLTPNRMEAMSHWGVARDVCAYLSHHDKKDCRPLIPQNNHFKNGSPTTEIDVTVENSEACPRYSGICISGLTIGESPEWLQQRLKSIGLRPINNIVDITNFIQHETGQPLHAFDMAAISGKRIVVKNLPQGTKFITLDGKERILSAEDLMICAGNSTNEQTEEAMCIAGVFGGLNSGVSAGTVSIFLESAFFDPIITRKTSFRHGLRTEAASRFEKGTDISATVSVLQRAATMVTGICGGEISSAIVDIYPDPHEKTQVSVKYHYLKKIAGKNYHPDAVKDILKSLGFEIVREDIDELRVAVPFHHPDISMPADIAEEILRIDGLDNVDIPDAITITPAVEENYTAQAYQEKMAGHLTGLGFYEIMTNSITNAGYFEEEELGGIVKMMNSLSAELNVMRPSLLETSLEVIAHNLNHKNNDLKFFEFGKAYGLESPGKYKETEKLCILVSGRVAESGWNIKNREADLYFLKGVAESMLNLMGIRPESIEPLPVPKFDEHLVFKLNGAIIGGLGKVSKRMLSRFEIKQPVYFAGFNWEELVKQATLRKNQYHEIPKFPAVQRDLAIVLADQLPYARVQQTMQKIKLDNLRAIKLFDVFESEKLGAGKKSMAINFTFQDEEKTLTDKEIDAWMQQIMTTLQSELQAEIRK